jgi:hypothetical protein
VKANAPLAWLILAIAASLGCSDAAESLGPLSTRPHNLILISIDTLRADRLGCYGYDRKTSPSSDHLDTRDCCGKTDYNALGLTPGQALFLSDRYDAGIRYADDLLGAFLERVEALLRDLNRHFEGLAASTDSASAEPAGPPGERERERLRSLGYVD